MPVLLLIHKFTAFSVSIYEREGSIEIGVICILGFKLV